MSYDTLSFYRDTRQSQSMITNLISRCSPTLQPLKAEHERLKSIVEEKAQRCDVIRNLLKSTQEELNTINADITKRRQAAHETRIDSVLKGIFKPKKHEQDAAPNEIKDRAQLLKDDIVTLSEALARAEKEKQEAESVRDEHKDTMDLAASETITREFFKDLKVNMDDFVKNIIMPYYLLKECFDKRKREFIEQGKDSRFDESMVCNVYDGSFSPRFNMPTEFHKDGINLYESSDGWVVSFGLSSKTDKHIKNEYIESEALYLRFLEGDVQGGAGGQDSIKAQE